MLPPRVDSVVPATGAEATTNVVRFHGNLLTLGLSHSPPVVRCGRVPVRCRWIIEWQTNLPPDGMVGGSQPSTLTVWLPRRCAGRRVTVTYMGSSTTLDLPGNVALEPPPDEAGRTGVIQLLRQWYRRDPT